MLSGPAETGKTLASLQYLNNLAWEYPGAQLAVVRKTYKSMPGSVLQTLKERVLGPKSPVRIYGGEKPEWYDYPNGSRIWIAGMDNPTRVLSSERDVVYVNQAEELELPDWETLSTRVTGRAGHIMRGGAPWSQLFGDCNPGPETHWIKTRAAVGDLLLLESRHKDNPTLYDPKTGEITERGRRTMARLDKLTGVRRKRLRDGLWVSAEGVVYEGYDPALHVVPSEQFAFPIKEVADIPAHWRRIVSIDFGYTNPFSASWWAIDGDGRMLKYRQIYMTGRLVEEHQRHILFHSMGENIEAYVADHDAEDRATLEQARIFYCEKCRAPILNAKAEEAHKGHGVRSGRILPKPAKKALSRGIQAVGARLLVAGDNKPRLLFLRGSLVERDEALAAEHRPLCTEDEFGSYVWPKGADGKAKKETPVDDNNHGLDEMRYAVMYVDEPDAPAKMKASTNPFF